MNRFLALLALPFVALLSACGDDLPSPTLAMPVAHTITDASAGPIVPGTAYSSAAIQRLFPGADTQVVRTADSSGVVNAIAVNEEGLQVLQVLSDGSNGVRAVHGTGLAVAGPNGERLGATFREAGVSRDACRVGTGPWAGMADCAARGARNVRLVFDNGGWDGPPDTLPPQGQLRQARLQRIVWTPPAE